MARAKLLLRLLHTYVRNLRKEYEQLQSFASFLSTASLTIVSQWQNQRMVKPTIHHG